MEEIYKKYSKLVYRYLYGLTKNHELSEELMQETFYSAIKGIKSFRQECSIYSWLCQIAKNKWKNHVSKNNKIKIIQFDEALETEILVENLEEKFFHEGNLYNEIKKLDNLTREVVYLRVNGEFSFKEIGRILDKSEVWARTTFYRAKLKLREVLKNERAM